MEFPDGTNHKEHVFIPINTPGHWSLFEEIHAARCRIRDLILGQARGSMMD
ncbi:hypothetical protein CHS0354_020100 [Potamilus streckersoni]|uniref:Uncharacterized protein n=1 Tax=Potamilus streckersoni TaxID=2493646 RepID=A0AAE0VPF1_9BIVA|nr:hypothetical protein CHS0354_020100 [Potamilus streckersoni]